MDRERIERIVKRGMMRLNLGGGIELLDQTFFDPTINFIEWAKAQEETLVDCGAGMGQLLDLVPGSVGIDIAAREGQHERVVPLEASLFTFGPEYVALLARPSGGDWIADTFYMALTAGSSAFYAGLDRNVDTHLHGFNRELVMDSAGDGGERLWEVRLEQEDKHAR